MHVRARFIRSEISRKVQRALATGNRLESRIVRRLAGAAIMGECWVVLARIGTWVDIFLRWDAVEP